MINNKRIALFIDSDNISSQFYDEIFSKASSYGTVSLKRIYGDWSRPKQGWSNDNIREYGLKPVHQASSSKNSGKNSTDIVLVIDVMNILYQEKYDMICIASSDSDFVPLIQEVKERGLMTIGFGEDKTPQYLKSSYDDFFILEKDKKDPIELEDDVKDLQKFDQDIYNALKILEKQSDNELVHYGNLVSYMKRLRSDFMDSIFAQNFNRPLDYILESPLKKRIEVIDRRKEEGTGGVYVRTKEKKKIFFKKKD